MKSSSPDAAAPAGVRTPVQSMPFAMPELRSGTWTRLGGTAVLGDAVTEHTLSGLAEEAKAAARAQGYTVGWSEGRRDAAVKTAELTDALRAEHEQAEQRREAEHRAALAALAAAAADLRAAVAVTCAEVESHGAAIALSLTEQLLGRELAIAETPGLDAVRRALTLLPGDAVVTRIRISPDEATSPALAELAGTATVVADPGLGRGDVVVESPESVVDARVSEALARVREVLAP